MKSRANEYTENNTDRVQLAGKAIGRYSKAAEDFYFCHRSKSSI